VKKSTDFEKIAHLIPLRVTDDLSTHEAQLVDETARYDEKSRAAVQSYQHLMGVLQEAAFTPLRQESSVIRGERSLWDRIEPQLGPVAKPRPSLLERIPTGYLAIACGLLICVTALTEFGGPLHQALPVAVTQGWGQGGVQTIGNEPGAGLRPIVPGNVNVRVNLAVPIAGESISIPKLGLVVTRVERVIQRVVGLADMNAVLITDVQAGSVAEKAGLHKGDCLVGVDGQKIYAPLHALEVLDKQLADGEAPFEVIRGGQKISVPVNVKTESDQSARVPSLFLGEHDISLSV
jgi:hypothetical protein